MWMFQRSSGSIFMTLPFDPGIGFWKALLGGCRNHLNMELGELAARNILDLDPENVSSYIMLNWLLVDGVGLFSKYSKKFLAKMVLFFSTWQAHYLRHKISNQPCFNGTKINATFFMLKKWEKKWHRFLPSVDIDRNLWQSNKT